jgi:Flp pilus assembly pilin Flp
MRPAGVSASGVVLAEARLPTRCVRFRSERKALLGVVYFAKESIHRSPMARLNLGPQLVRMSIQARSCDEGGSNYASFFPTLLSSEQGQDIAEYAVMVAVILLIVIGTIRLIGSNSNTVFSNVASALH